MRRFIARKSRSDDSEGGEQWQVVDLDGLRVVSECDRASHAHTIADALEFLSLNALVSQFEHALEGDA